MPGQTPVFALPYPLGDELVKEGDDVLKALVERIEALLGAPSGNRNVIRNGDFSIAQRGGGPFNGASGGGYTLDGWIYAGAGGTMSLQRNSLSLNGWPQMSWGVTSTVSGQSSSSDGISLLAPIENIRTLNAQQVAISFVAYAAGGSAGSKIGVEVEQYFGSGGSASGAVYTPAGAITLSTTSTRFTVVVTLPTVNGKVLGTDGKEALKLRLWLSAGSTFATRASNIGIQNATITVGDVQMELGPVPTPFERIPIQQQLAWCQRYYWRQTAIHVSAPMGRGNGTIWGPGSNYFVIAPPISMRAVPTLFGWSAVGALVVWGPGASSPGTALNLSAASTVSGESIEFYVTTAAFGVSGQSVWLRAGAVGSWLECGAEL